MGEESILRGVLMRIFVFILVVLVCIPQPSSSKDIGDLFGQIFGGVLNEATRQQRKKHERRQQRHQLRTDIDSCINRKIVASCDRALASPVLNPNKRWQVQQARNRAAEWQRSQTDYTGQTHTSGTTSNRQAFGQQNRHDHSREKSRSAELQHDLEMQSNRIAILRRRVREVKAELHIQSERAQTLLLKLNTQTQEFKKQNLLYQVALLISGILTVLIAAKLWQVKHSISRPEHLYRDEDSLALQNIESIEPVLLAPPAPSLFEDLIITGNMPSDIRNALHG